MLVAFKLIQPLPGSIIKHCESIAITTEQYLIIDFYSYVVYCKSLQICMKYLYFINSNLVEKTFCGAKDTK